MKKYFIVSLVAIFLVATKANAQEPSWNKKMGDRYFQSYSFFEAIKKYEFIKTKDDDTVRKLAQAYYYTADYQKSEEYYALLVASDSKTSQDIYKYASVLSVNKKYDEADAWMKQYKAMASKTDSKAKQFGQNPDFYKALAQSKKNIVVKNLAMNTKHTDFPASFYKNKLIYTSSNPLGVDIKKKWNWNELPFLDLYQANTDSALELSNIKSLLDSKVKYHRGPATFNKKGDFMVFTANSQTKNNIIRLKLYYSNLVNDTWTTPKEMPFNSEDFSTGLATLTANGRTIYFASDRPGTLGNSDLWVAYLQADSTWSEPKNLGSEVNTEGKETFPFIHNNETLYFSSDGLPGLGGLDIYTIPILKFGEVEPENLGAPFNSSHDDFAFLLAEDQMGGYFASNREGGHGNDDIYKFKVLIIKKIIQGFAYDQEKNKLNNVKVYLKNEVSEIIDSITSDTDGKFNFTVDADKIFTLTGEKEKYTKAKSSADTHTENKIIETNLNLNLIPDLSLRYVVTDKKTGTIIEGVKIRVLDNRTGKTEEITTSETGEFVKKLVNAKLNDKLDYKIQLLKKGFLTEDIDYKVQLSENKEYVVNLKLEEIKVGTDIAVLKGVTIHFDYRAFNIDANAQAQLDKFVKVMNDNPTIKVELSSHTDCRGTDIYNSHLSDKRAKASAAYVKARITNPERLTGRGYGATKPIAKCKCGSCTEEQHRKNRRTEFVIIRN